MINIKHKKIILSVIIVVLFLGIFSVVNSLFHKNTTDEVSDPNAYNPITNTIVQTDFFSFSHAGYGLATTPDEIVKKSYIPACSTPFDYCIYYNMDNYGDTNFEAAGIRISKMPQLDSMDLCLNTPPEGYSDIVPNIYDNTDHLISTYSPIEEGAAGHYSTGKIYRLAYGGSCFEFETRVAETQFANYPEGTKVEFSAEKKKEVIDSLNNILDMVRLNGREENIRFTQFN